MVAFALLAGGVGGTVATVLDWQRAGFGDLNPTTTLRMLIPSLLAVELGVQQLLGVAFLSILRYRG